METMSEQSETTRLSVNINPDTAEFLREAAQREGRSIAEVIRRAVSVYKFMAYDAAGDIYVEDENGKRTKVMIL